jgi:hypothetical protein
MTFKFIPRRKLLEEHGYASVAHIPFLLSHDLAYEHEANRFLRERALHDWVPKRGHPAFDGGSGIAGSRARVLNENACIALADDLENFLTYAQVHRIDWHKITFGALLASYQEDMLKGTWSAAGRGLAPQTVNRRMRTVCEFLLWASDHQLRPPFAIRTSTRRRNRRATSRRCDQVETRIGKVRANPELLRLPTTTEISAWLAEVEVRRGPTKALACRSVIEMGWRLDEVASARADQVVTAQPGARMDWPCRVARMAR